MGRASRRKHKASRVGNMFGVELFEDSRLLSVVLYQLHYDAMDGSNDPPFPLADADDRTKTNANTVTYLVRQHPDARMHLIVHHRYFHRDSQDPSDGLDLKRSAVYTVDKEATIADMVTSFCRFVATNEHFRLCADPAVYDLSVAPIEMALDALTTLPFVHVRVEATPANGVH